MLSELGEIGNVGDGVGRKWRHQDSVLSSLAAAAAHKPV